MKRADCAFCELGPESERIISQGNLATSFLSDPSLTPGHALVIPNRHVEVATDLSTAEILATQYEIRRLGSLMLGSFAKGVDVWQKTRLEVPEGQGVKMNHLHYHVLPSKPGNARYEHTHAWGMEHFSRLKATERNKFTKLLRP